MGDPPTRERREKKGSIMGFWKNLASGSSADIIK